MLNKVEKNLVSEVCHDLIVEVLTFDLGSLKYINIFDHVLSHTRYASYADELEYCSLTAIIDQHLNTLITDQLVEITAGENFEVYFRYIAY